MDSPLISILLPVYNGEKTLNATLKSLLHQTFSDFEIIIGIDGTSDASKAIALGFNDKRIRIIEQPTNLGLADNLNEIIKYASSKSRYLAMAEQDDIYVPERLELQLDIMETHKDVGLVSGIAEFISDGKSVYFPGILTENKQFPVGEEMFRYLYVNQLKVVNTCMFWRKDRHGFQNLKFKNTYGNFNVDWNFMLRFSLKHKIVGIPKVLVKMNRRRSNNSITSNKTQQHIASRQLLKDFRNEFPDLISSKLYRQALKAHRKIELGHNTKFRLTILSFAYLLRYADFYFLKYYLKRLRGFGMTLLKHKLSLTNPWHIHLYWYTLNRQDKKENYGDVIGPFIISKLTNKKIVQVKAKEIKNWKFKYFYNCYFTVGSILNRIHSNATVWGSGIITSNERVENGNFLLVRGPLTRKRLLELNYNVPQRYGDPALLLPKFIPQPNNDKIYDIGIIPHYVDYDDVLEVFNETPNIKVINLLTDNLEKTTLEILQCKQIISSSLHGVIVSHAYHISALWVKFSDKLSGDNIKFFDYFESVGIHYRHIIEKDIKTVVVKDFESLLKENENILLPNKALLKERLSDLMATHPFKK